MPNDGPRVDVADRDDAEAFIASPRLEVHVMKNGWAEGWTTSKAVYADHNQKR